LLLTNFVVLDFTPDAIANEYVVGKFADVFAPASVNVNNRFLDYNGDAKISAEDAQIAVGKIASRVNRIRAPFKNDPEIDLIVMHTTKLNSTDDPGAGEKRLAAGQASAEDNSYVLYVGDKRPSANACKYGMAFQAFAGENNEFYGYVFAGAISEYVANGGFGWKPQNELRPIDFTNQVAFGVAHELGHLLGLGHLLDGDSTPTNRFSPTNYHHVMNAINLANPATARYLADTTHLMEMGNPSTGTSSQQNFNAPEVHENLLPTASRSQNGLFPTDTSLNLATHDPINFRRRANRLSCFLRPYWNPAKKTQWLSGQRSSCRMLSPVPGVW